MSVKVSRRITKQRQLVFNTLVNNPVHPTADYIYNQLKPDYPEISLGTVYRNLSVLYEQGKISIVPGNFQSDRFDGVPEPHYHFICNSCGEIFDMDIPYIDVLDDKAKNSLGFKVESHNLTFNGYCQNCVDKSE